MPGARLAFAFSIALVTALAAAGSAPAEGPACLPTAERTVGPHGFRGLGVKRIAPVYTDAASYVGSWGEPAARAQQDIATLNGEGFISGTFQLYFGRKRKTRGDQGAAATEQFRSSEGALADLEDIWADVLKFGPWKQFTVPAIPGSRGLRAKYFDHSGASNVYFTDGDYFYFVGRFVRRGGTGAGQVIRAALELYARVHGATACT